MEKFIALHTYLRNPGETWEFFGQGAPGLAAQMAAGQTPARCLKTWNPLAHGRADYIFCLWEAETAEDVHTVLRDSGMAEYVTADVMPVAEVDWTAIAQAVPQGEVA